MIGVNTQKFFFEIEKIINSILSWIDGFKIFAGLQNFSIMLGLLVRDLSDLISQLIEICKPAPGKKVSKKKQIKAFEKKIDPILENIASFLVVVLKYLSFLHFYHEKNILKLI